MVKREFYILVETDSNGGFLGESAQYGSCRSLGKTLDELLANMRGAIQSRMQDDCQDSHSEISGFYRLEVAVKTPKGGRQFYVLVKDDGEGGYIGIAPELKGCLSHGLTLNELMSNMDEVIRLCLEDGEEAENPCFFGIQRVTI